MGVYNNLFVNKVVEMFKPFPLSIMDVLVFKMKLLNWNIVMNNMPGFPNLIAPLALGEPAPRSVPW